jgi:hypothetical protein
VRLVEQGEHTGAAIALEVGPASHGTDNSVGQFAEAVISGVGDEKLAGAVQG